MIAPLVARTARVLCVLAAGLAVFPACGSTPPSRFYVLTPAANPAAGRDHAGLTVRLETVQLPQAVHRPQLVTVVSQNELDFAEYHRWAEPLEANVARVLVENLQARLGGALVFGSNDMVVPAIDVSVAVDIQELRGTLDGSCQLSARWHVADQNEWRASGHGTYEVPTTGSDHLALVAAMSTALDRLAADVAAAIEGLAVEPEDVMPVDSEATDGEPAR